MAILGDIQLALFEGHSEWLYWGMDIQDCFIGIFNLPFLGDIQDGFIGGCLTCPFEGYSAWPYWGIFTLVLYGGHSGWLYWGIFNLPFLRDIQDGFIEGYQLTLFEGYSAWPYWGIFTFSFLRDIQHELIGGYSGWFYYRIFNFYFLKGTSTFPPLWLIPRFMAITPAPQLLLGIYTLFDFYCFGRLAAIVQ